MQDQKKLRETVIVRTSAIGIAANVVLAAFKAFVGLAANSIAITLDAVNNLSDALSSIVTIIGARLANKKPDKQHPLGHGRVEYMSQLIVAAIVLYAGITSAVESAKKILWPETADYTIPSLVVVASAIVVKIVLGAYVKRKGHEVNSGALIASGEDASFDAILSASVLGSAIVFLATGVSLEAYVGALISFFIVKSGIEMISDAVNEMLGMRISSELSRKIKEVVCQEPEVRGAYDLLLHNYGPDRYLGSVHVEIDDTLTAAQIDELTRRIQEHVYRACSVVITTVGIYSHNTDDAAAQARMAITKMAMEHDDVLQVHGFYMSEADKDIRFDVIIGFGAQDREALCSHIIRDAMRLYPGYTVRVTLDTDVSD